MQSLIQKLQQTPNDQEIWQVYADWLQIQGNVLGVKIIEHLQGIYTITGNDLLALPQGLKMPEIYNFFKLLHYNRYVDNNDETVLDLQNHLMWMRCYVDQKDNQSANTFIWEQAIHLTKDYYFVTYQDWRLPTRKELLSIVNQGAQPALYLDLFCNANYPIDPQQDQFCWTNSPSTKASAWVVNFKYGTDSFGFDKTKACYIRLVRDFL